MKKILIVDDNAEFRSHLMEVLGDSGYVTGSAASAKEAYEQLRSTPFDLVLLDFMMPKQTGIEALAEMKRLCPKIKVIMITAFASIENAIDAVRKGVSDYISKPFKIDDLLLTIRRVLEEATFEAGMKKLDLDTTLSTLANPIRRKILALLQDREDLHLMEITRELNIEDHTKVVFHLRMLKEAGIITQGQGKNYLLSTEGRRLFECLKTLERYLTA